MTSPKTPLPAGRQSNTGPGSEAICPHIGGPKDQDVFYQYPSNWNRCYRPEKPSHVNQIHQETYCLCAYFAECPVYKPGWDGNFPEEAKAFSMDSGRNGRPSWTRQQKLIVNSFIALALVGLIIAFFGLNTPSGRTEFLARLGLALPAESEAALNPTAEPVPLPTATLSPPTPTQTAAATELPTQTAEPTVTGLPTSTPFPTPGPGFGTPFGPDAGFVIHVVVVGESYTSIARKYGSSPEAIEAINLTYEGASLWVGQQLVVPVNITDAGDLPEFTIIFTTEIISLDELARLYASEANRIRFYNAIGDSEDVPPGRWLIIPVIQSN